MTATESDVLLYEKKGYPGTLGKVVVMTINRPERMNAVSIELANRLADAWQEFEEDEEAWVAILTGAGDRAFCSGADLSDPAIKAIGSGGGTGKRREAAPSWISKPTIAAINGFALAGGWQFAQICDIRIAAEHAEMGIAETKWNLGANWVCDLTRELNIGHALEIALWGDKRITAQRAYEMGWVNRVVPKEKLMEEALSWAERMLYLGPRSVRNMKETIYRGYYMQTELGRRFGSSLSQNLRGMDDTSEGPRAFSEKRKPQFKNR